MTSELWTLWWVWLSAALVLGIVEVLAPGFVFLGFAIGAAAVAALLATTGAIWSPPLLLLVFAALSLVAWLAMRRYFSRPKGQVKIITEDIND